MNLRKLRKVTGYNQDDVDDIEVFRGEHSNDSKDD